MNKNILITGVNGFVGHHLVQELKDNDCKVWGTGMQPGAAADIAQTLDGYFSADLTDLAQVEKLPLADFDAIISLAGLARVGASFKDPELYMKVNVAVVKNISQALLSKQALKTRHLAISTGAVYDARQKPPFSEDSVLAQNESPYAMSKIAMEKASQSHRNQGLDIVIARPFNHIGPGQETGFLLPDLVQQARNSISEGTPIRVGNLDTKRDYTDVRDVVRAYRMLALAESLKYSVYNVCSGRSVTGKKILDLVLKQLAKDNLPQVVVDPKKFRPSDAPDIFGSYERLHEETGWQPERALEQTVTDFVGNRTDLSDDQPELRQAVA